MTVIKKTVLLWSIESTSPDGNTYVGVNVGSGSRHAMKQMKKKQQKKSKKNT